MKITHPRQSNLAIVFTAKRLAQAFGAIVFCLVSAHVVTQTIRFATGDDRLFGLVRLFALGAERNLPTFYSSAAILICACLLTLIGYLAWRSERRWSAYWFALALVFVFLSLDETLQIHERLMEPMQRIFSSGGMLYFAWIVPYAVGLVILLAIYVRFLLHIPRRTAILFIVAGAMFVGGTIFLAMISGVVFEMAYIDEGTKSLKILFEALQTLEEILEMSGIVVFMYALVDYMEKSTGELQLILGRQWPAAQQAN